MSKTIEQNLMPGEVIIEQRRLPKTNIIVKSVLIICTYLSFAIMLMSLLYPLIIVVVLYLCVHYTGKGNAIILTNKRLLILTGVLTKSSKEFILNKIESIEIEMGFLSKKIGKLKIRGTGTGKNVFLIENPLEFRNKIYEAIEANQKPNLQ